MSDKDEADKPKHESQKSPISTRKAKKLTKLKEYLSKQESLKNSRKVSGILKKRECDRTEEEKKTLADNDVIVRRIHKNKERRLLTEQRVLETEDSEAALQEKCQKLAREISKSTQTVIYTGAGISTAASIPDYRGPQGVWTLLQKGEQLVPQDLSDAEPTLTHMCIKHLRKRGHVSHVVSQNCDGLHVRSGLPRNILSEVHGNMYMEICYSCKPHREYLRLFDVTERTGVRRHETGRLCKKCGGKLKDTIVHFGEKGGFKSPYRWKEAVRAANKSDLILCLGSSLKILKKYSCLWCMDRARNKRPKLVIVNLQWTPKDSDSFLKINGRCDDVLQRVMEILKYDIPEYSRDADPIFVEAIALEKGEVGTTSKKILERPVSLSHLPLKTVPRSRTPSISSDSDCSETSDSSGVETSDSSTDSEDDIDELLEITQHSIQVQNHPNPYTVDVKQRDSKPSGVKHHLNISSTITRMKDRVKAELDTDGAGRRLTKEELFMIKSEQICNEAKRAMQLKSNQTADNPHNVTVTSHHSNLDYANHPPSDSSKNGFHKDEQVSNWVQQLESISQLDPSTLAQAESFSSYEERVTYLQTLQGQLHALKQKLHNLKQTETSTSGHENNAQLHALNQKLHALKQTELSSRHGNSATDLTSIQIQGQETQNNHQAWSNNPLGNNAKTTDRNGDIIDKRNTNKQGTPIVNHVKVETDFPPSYNTAMQDQIKAYHIQEQKVNINIQEQIQAYRLQEQKVNEELIESQQKEFEKEKTEMKRQQENDHRRMYQQFVIQLQVAEQAQLGEQKKAEMMQVFAVQQKIMLNKQTAQLQELYRKHQAQRQVLTSDIEKRHKELEASIQSLHNTSQIEFHRPVVTGPKQEAYQEMTHENMLKPQTSVYPTNFTIAEMLSPKQRNNIVSPKSQSGKPGYSDTQSDQSKVKDTPVYLSQHGQQELLSRHSSATMNHKLLSPKDVTHLVNPTVTTVKVEEPAENIKQNEIKIPGFSELVQGIITCESCAFLKNYGMSKKRCTNCDSLKMKYGLVQNLLGEEITENEHQSGDTTTALMYSQGTLKTALEEPLQTNQRFFGPSSTCQPSTSHSQALSQFESLLAVGDAQNQLYSVCSQSQLPVHDSQNQLYTISQYAQGTSHQPATLCRVGSAGNLPQIAIHSPTHPQVALHSPTYLSPTSVSGRASNMTVSNTHHYSGMDNSSMCPPHTTSFVTSGHLDCPETSSDQELSPVIPYASLSSSSITSSHVNKTPFAFVIPENTFSAISVDLSSGAKRLDNSFDSVSGSIIKQGSVKNEITNDDNPFKILDKVVGAPFRPRSQSEVCLVESDEVAVVSEKRQVRSHSHSEVLESAMKDESPMEVKDVEPNAAKIGKKRKSSTNVSVPGWFGKGLNLKKKRRC